MSGSTISIIVITVAFALFAFILAFLIASLLSANKIAADKRMEALKKDQGEEEVVLVKNESVTTKKKKQIKENQNGFFVKIASSLYKELQRADIKMRPEEFLIIWLVVAFIPGFLTILVSADFFVLAIALILIGSIAPLVLIRFKQKQRVKKFEDQLSDALMIACSSLRSGLSFNQAMEAIANDMDDPIANEFKTVIAEVNMGTPMDDALERMNDRVKSPYLSLLVSSVLVQRQTGGNLSNILENIADSIKEKMKLKQELKSSTASGKTTGLIVGMMPVVLCLLFLLVNKEFIMPLFTTNMGHVFLGMAIGLEVLCFFAIKKITNVKM